MRKREDQVVSQIRLEQELHARLAKAAEEDRRSMNAEIQTLIDLGLKVRERLQRRYEQQLDAIAQEL